VPDETSIHNLKRYFIKSILILCYYLRLDFQSVHHHFDIQYMPLTISVRYARLLRGRVGFIGLSNYYYYMYIYFILFRIHSTMFIIILNSLLFDHCTPTLTYLTICQISFMSTMTLNHTFLFLSDLIEQIALETLFNQSCKQ
jgi:hypothetical protein